MHSYNRIHQYKKNFLIKAQTERNFTPGKAKLLHQIKQIVV